MSSTRHGTFLRLFLQQQTQLHAWILAQGVAPSEADDVLQDAAVVLLERFEDFEPGSNFRAWSFAVVRNLVKRHFERSKRRPVLALSDQIQDQIADELMDDELQVSNQQLQHCLAHLTGHARELLQLRYFEQLSPMDMAARLGISAGAVRVRLHRIRTQLATCLGRELPQ
jgi:RNA polymerase sigma-70 factor, ECF subfamily